MNNYNQAPPMQPAPVMSNKYLMQRSPALKACTTIAILLALTVIILSILVLFVDCSDSHSCSYYYPNNPLECETYLTYCCSYDYSYCGDYSSCQYKPSEYDICWGLIYALWIGCGLLVVIAIAVVIITASVKRKIREEMFNRNMQYGQQPVFVQPQPGFPQQGYIQPGQPQPYIQQGQPPLGYIQQGQPPQMRPQPNDLINGPINRDVHQNGGHDEYQRI